MGEKRSFLEFLFAFYELVCVQLHRVIAVQLCRALMLVYCVESVLWGNLKKTCFVNLAKEDVLLKYLFVIKVLFLCITFCWK